MKLNFLLFLRMCLSSVSWTGIK